MLIPDKLNPASNNRALDSCATATLITDYSDNLNFGFYVTRSSFTFPQKLSTHQLVDVKYQC